MPTRSLVWEYVIRSAQVDATLFNSPFPVPRHTLRCLPLNDAYHPRRRMLSAYMSALVSKPQGQVLFCPRAFARYDNRLWG